MSVTVAEGGRGSPDFSHLSRLRLPESGRFSTGRLSSAGLSSPTMTSPGTARRFERQDDARRPGSVPETPTDAAESAGGAASRTGHIRVAVRVRPLPAGEHGIIEVAGEGAIAIWKEAATGGNQFLASGQGRVEQRQFDRVFGPDSRQEEVYTWTCEPLVQEAMAEGRNATVFVYGATGAGKTHTMFGGETESRQGIIFRAVREVFAQIDAQRQASDCPDDEEDDGRLEVRVSFLELYNEAVRDLLNEGGGQMNCRVLEDERRGVVQVSNLVEVPVRSAEEALCLLRAGMEARTVEATAANSQSSRAHAVFSLSVDRVRHRAHKKGVFKNRSGEARIPYSKISLIDLAGSERAKDTHNTGSALKDGARINQSLLALANCIDALTAKGGRENSATAASLRKKPPYRDSKLTLMLKGSLTGDSLVAMVANVHPGRTHFEDSNNTLEYAMRASNVRPRDRRKSRLSMGNPQVASSRLSMEPPPASARERMSARRSRTQELVATSADEQATEEENVCIASSSTLPPPTPDQGRILRKPIATGLKAPSFNFDGRAPEVVVGDSAESTASSQGLPSPTNELVGDGAQASLPASITSEDCLSDLGHDELLAEDCSEEGDIPLEGSAARATTTRAVAESQREEPLGCGVVGNSEHMCAQSGTLMPELATSIIESLQAEKVDVDARLRAVVAERDALLEDRAQLELENARLRAANLEKDRQIAALCASGPMLSLAPETP